MSALGETITADVQAIAADMGNPSFSWNDESYECLAGAVADTLVLGDGGLEQQADLALNVRKELFTDAILPRPQQKIIYALDGRTYRIATVNLDPLGVLVRLLCVSAKRGV